jgi:hypothetical protein
MSRRLIAVTVGVLFFVQMATAMVGTFQIDAFAQEGGAPPRLGVMMMGVSGLAVVGIGLLMYQVLKEVNQRLAIWYPVMRMIECTVSVALGVYLLAQLEVFPNYLLWVYIPTGIGGLVLCYLLYVSLLVPRSIAVLGLVGYGLFTAAVPLDLLGVLNMNEGLGLVILVPGFLFEFAALPLWLIIKGFNSARDTGQHLTGAGARELTPRHAAA